MLVTVHALGGAEIEVGKTRITPTSAKKFAFLLYLASERGRRVPRPALQELLFPDAGDKSAAHALRELIYQLRNARIPLDADKASVGLSAEAVRSDYSEVVEAEDLDERQVRAVEGGFLPGYAPSFSRPFAEWLDGYRARVSREISASLLRRATQLKEAGEIPRATKIAQALLALEPLNEDATLIVAESLALGGSKVQAIELLESYRRETGLSREMTLPAGVLRKRIMNSPVSTSAQRVSVFAGRQAEMAAIAEALKAGESGEARIVALTGEPGIGKTRIATEASNRAALNGWKVVNVRTQPGDQQRPLAAFADVVPQLMNAPGALGCSPENIGWLRRLIEHDPRTTNGGDGSYEGVAAAISGAIKDLIDAVAGESPLLFVIDDVQWIDHASERLVREIITDPAPHRVTVLVTSRNREAVASLEEQNGQFTSAIVGPLSATESQSVVSSQLVRGRDADLIDWIVETAQGNPFFLESLAHHSDTTGERFVIPPRVTQLIDARISNLPPDARHVLSTTVRLAKRASLVRLRDAADLTHSRFAQAIARLERDGLIRMDDAVRPSHWLVAEAESRLLTPIAARTIHARIAEILQRELEQHSDSSLPWDLFEHFLAAGDNRQAAYSLTACAHHALSIGRARDAAELQARAASLAASSEEQQQQLFEAIRFASITNEVDVLVRIGEALNSLGARMPNDVYLALLLAKLGNELATAGEHPRLRELFRDSNQAIANRVQAARLFLISCDQERLPASALEAEPELRAVWSDPEVDETASLGLQMIFETIVSDEDNAVRIAERLFEISNSSRSDIAATLRRNCAIAFLRTGATDKALRIWESVHRDATRLGLVRSQYSVALMLAHTNLDAGNDEAARRWHGTISKHTWGCEDQAPQFIRIAFEADLAFTDNDADAFLRVLDKSRQLELDVASGRVRRWFRSADLYGSHLRGVSPPDAAVASQAFHGMQPALELGDASDFQIAVSIRILVDRKQVEAARAVASQYFDTYRRKRSLLSAPLRAALRELDYSHSSDAKPNP